ncbi:MAG: hypothetical protein JSV16_15060 [Candidatus Hydrogenedentota bacterium]|nr:MAG: hypothetical protein JSV16_15060 [Candidatus Hydrogenedentota bacterium]
MEELIPKGLPKGMDLVEEGKKIGETIQIGKNAFETQRNMPVEEWWLTETAMGNIKLFPQMGLRTIDEQVEATTKLYEEGRKRGVDFGAMFVTSNVINGLPADVRDKAPRGTSFIYESPEDYKRVMNAAPIYVVFADHVVGCPNSVENAINVLTAGSRGLGTFSQFTWKYPTWDDDIGQIAETLKAVGIIASKRDEFVNLGSYIGDGIAGSFLDHASDVGYALLEKYIVDKLCGASYNVSVGGLISRLPSKLATWLAIFEAGKEDSFDPIVGHYEGNTVEVRTDTAAHGGILIGDFIPFAGMERRYRTGALYTPKPVTEALRVPTLDEIVDAAVACNAAMPRVLEIEEAGIFDDSEILKLRDVLVENGKKFFDNILKGLPDLGVDIEDPLQIMLAMTRLGGGKLEEMFHPGERDSSRYRGIVPFAVTYLFSKSDPLANSLIETVRSEDLADAIRDRKIVVGSADTHEFGLYVLSKVVSEIGGKAVDCGVDLDPRQVLDIAAREGTPYIAISIHNGQCVGWGEQLMREAMQRRQEVKVFMGGKLNTMEEYSTEPVDASEKLIELGITPCEDPLEMARKLAQ